MDNIGCQCVECSRSISRGSCPTCESKLRIKLSDISDRLLAENKAAEKRIAELEEKAAFTKSLALGAFDAALANGDERDKEKARAETAEARVAELERRLVAHDSCPKCPSKLLTAWEKDGTIVGKKCMACGFLVGEDVWSEKPESLVGRKDGA